MLYHFIFFTSILINLSFSNSKIFGQIINNPIERKELLGMASYKNDSLYIKITYRRPRCNELELLFGHKIPYRRLWRTGAGEATELTITDTVKIADKIIYPGIYSLFTIPDTAMWTIVLNMDVGLQGLYKYNQEKDIFREKIPIYRSPKLFKYMTFFFEKTSYGTDLIFIWQFTSFRISFSFL